jgi:hypothetical protein
MAEPLSIALGTLTGIEKAINAISRVKYLVQEWKDAPAQITSLSQEIENSYHVTLQLAKLRERLDGNYTDAIYGTLIDRQIARGEPHWDELKKLLSSLQEKTGRLRQAGWMKHKGRFEILKHRLRDLRLANLEILSIDIA